jgi:glycosyltransferase involved in cell wall biosynthesis
VKIAFLFNEYQPHVLSRISYFLNKGHVVYYFALWSPVPVSKKHLPDQLHYIPIPCNWLMKIKYIRFFRGFFLVQKLTKVYSIDILHIVGAGHGLHALFSNSKINVIQNLGSDMLVWPKQRPIFKLLYKLFYKYCDAVIQDSYLSQTAGFKYGAHKNNNLIIETGIDLNKFHTAVEKGRIRKKLGLRADKKIVLSPRNLSENYNIDTIIKAIPIVKKQIKDVVFIFIYFSDTLEYVFKKLVKTLNIQDNVFFESPIDSENIPSYYIDSDIVVSVPSSDSSPSSVYEAMACEKPVVVSDIPWYHRKFKKNQHLIAVPPKNAELLAIEIVSYLQEKKYLNLKEAAQIVSCNMNLIKENEKLEQLYTKLLDNTMKDSTQ